MDLKDAEVSIFLNRSLQAASVVCVFCEGFLCLIHMWEEPLRSPIIICFVELHGNWDCKVAFAFEEVINLNQNIYSTEKSVAKPHHNYIYKRDRYEFKVVKTAKTGDFKNKLSQVFLNSP